MKTREIERFKIEDILVPSKEHLIITFINPKDTFRPLNLVMDAQGAEGLIIGDIQVGRWSQFLS